MYFIICAPVIYDSCQSEQDPEVDEFCSTAKWVAWKAEFRKLVDEKSDLITANLKMMLEDAIGKISEAELR